MIALQTLKYKIFEWCMDAFTDKLISNFITVPNNLTKIPLEELREGMVITEIWWIINSHNYKTIWTGCRIQEITYWNPEKTLIKEVYFTWSTHWDTRKGKIDIDYYPPKKDTRIGGLADIQVYDQDLYGINDYGVTPGFYV